MTTTIDLNTIQILKKIKNKEIPEKEFFQIPKNVSTLLTCNKLFNINFTPNEIFKIVINLPLQNQTPISSSPLFLISKFNHETNLTANQIIQLGKKYSKILAKEDLLVKESIINNLIRNNKSQNFNFSKNQIYSLIKMAFENKKAYSYETINSMISNNKNNFNFTENEIKTIFDHSNNKFDNLLHILSKNSTENLNFDNKNLKTIIKLLVKTNVKKICTLKYILNFNKEENLNFENTEIHSTIKKLIPKFTPIDFLDYFDIITTNNNTEITKELFMEIAKKTFRFNNNYFNIKKPQSIEIELLNDFIENLQEITNKLNFKLYAKDLLEITKEIPNHYFTEKNLNTIEKIKLFNNLNKTIITPQKEQQKIFKI